jgi:hypothetical protein
MKDNNFWKKSELANQHVHVWWGMWSTIVVFSLHQCWIAFFTGLLVGVVVELLQWYGGADNYISRKWKDVIRDLFFWMYGGFLVYVAMWLLL